VLTLQGNLGGAADRVVLKVADIADSVPGEQRSLKLVTTDLTAGGDQLVFDFADADDTVVLAAGSAIIGFTTLEVKAGTVDISLASVPAGLDVVINSGLALSVAQFLSLSSVESGSGAGTLAITVSSAEEFNQLVAFLENPPEGFALSGVSTSLDPESSFTPSEQQLTELNSAVDAVTTPGFSVSESNGVVSFSGPATGAITITVDAAGTASFSREGTTASTTVSGLFSKQLDVSSGTSFNLATSGSDANDTFTINAPNVQALVFSGNTGAGVDELSVRVVDSNSTGYNTRILKLDTSGITNAELLSFIFDASAANSASLFDNDVVQLTSDSVISSTSGISTIKVRTGTLDVSQATVSAGMGFDVQSGIILSYS